MKKLFKALQNKYLSAAMFLLIAFNVNAQTPTVKWGVKNFNYFPFNGLRVDSVLVLPDTTFKAAPNGSIGVQNGVLFVKDTFYKKIVSGAIGAFLTHDSILHYGFVPVDPLFGVQGQGSDQDSLFIKLADSAGQSGVINSTAYRNLWRAFNNYTERGSYAVGTGILTLTRNNGNTFTVTGFPINLSQFTNGPGFISSITGLAYLRQEVRCFL
jgi:hypothetical protein